MTEGACVYPGIAGTYDGGLIYRWVASTEGGPRNGVLTAIEDFVAANTGLRLAIVPAFFGLGVVWSTEAPYAAAAAGDRRPVRPPSGARAPGGQPGAEARRPRA